MFLHLTKFKLALNLEKNSNQTVRTTKTCHSNCIVKKHNCATINVQYSTLYAEETRLLELKPAFECTVESNGLKTYKCARKEQLSLQT